MRTVTIRHHDSRGNRVATTDVQVSTSHPTDADHSAQAIRRVLRWATANSSRPAQEIAEAIDQTTVDLIDGEYDFCDVFGSGSTGGVTLCPERA